MKCVESEIARVKSEISNLRSRISDRRSSMRLLAALAAISAVPLAFAQSASPEATTQPTTLATPAWQHKVEELTWICYTPTGAVPDSGIWPDEASVRADLATLRRAGFDGLLTYGCVGVQGAPLVRIAESLGFRGMIVGVWNPTDPREHKSVRELAESKIVLGFCVGNEGCDKRYSRETLAAAIDDLRRDTGKPVTTTEEVDDYLDPWLLNLGDWVFPNSHPFFHGRQECESAIRWTRGAFTELKHRSGRFVFFKELGLPTAGDSKGLATEDAQNRYYEALAASDVQFAYFEAFDQPWKNWRPFESSWGIFTADRQTKLLAKRMIAAGGPVKSPSSGKENETNSAPPPKRDGPFYVYCDAGDGDNHFAPSGLDGDTGDITFDEAWSDNPHSGRTCIRIDYSAAGDGPHKCEYGPPCRWASLRWLQPTGNWGKKDRFAGQGIDLRGYRRVTFWARAERDCRIKFAVGGIDGPYGDSEPYPRSTLADLSTAWQRYEIDLRGADLGHIIGGFGWDTNWEQNPKGVTVFVDDIRYE